jgi:hypothetical protein
MGSSNFQISTMVPLPRTARNAASTDFSMTAVVTCLLAHCYCVSCEGIENLVSTGFQSLSGAGGRGLRNEDLAYASCSRRVPSWTLTKIERCIPRGSSPLTRSNGRTIFRPSSFSYGHISIIRISGSSFCNISPYELASSMILNRNLQYVSFTGSLLLDNSTRTPPRKKIG